VQSFMPSACVKMKSVLTKVTFVGGLEAVLPGIATKDGSLCEICEPCNSRKSRVNSGF
jgi:hypothetical protein